MIYLPMFRSSPREASAALGNARRGDPQRKRMLDGMVHLLSMSSDGALVVAGERGAKEITLWRPGQ